LNIKGVGLQKLKDFGDIFLETIKDYLNEHLSKEIMNNSNLKIAPIGNYQQRLEEIKDSPNAYESWTDTEETQLKSLYMQKQPIDEIARVLARQPGAIRSRLKKLGLIIG
jgi:hypothetical protein